VSEGDDALRGVLRDLIPDYTGPVDPLPRVVASVRRRRVRQRTLLAVSSAGAAAVVALGVPALIAAGPAGGQAAAPGGADPSGLPAAPRPEPPVFPVASGSVGPAAWAIGSVNLEAGSQRCLTSDDDLFSKDTACFTTWKAGSPVTWNAQVLPTVTRVVGVAPAGTATVRVRFTDRAAATVAAVRTPTDPAARFFGLVLVGDPTVRDVTALRADGTALGPPVAEPGAPACVPGPTVACATK
jgi:hypothetical protein